MTLKCNKCFDVVENKVASAFRVYGRFVARNPWKIIIIAVTINCLLGIGMVRLNMVKNVEIVYTPMGSQASRDTDTIKSIFPDLSGSNFRSHQMPNIGRYGQVIIRPNSGDVMDTSFLTSLGQLYTFLTQISTKDDNGNIVQYTDICAMRDDTCAIDGNLFVDSEFATAVNSNSVDYPFFNHPTRGLIYYAQDIAGVTVVTGKLQAATMVSLKLHLRTDTSYYTTIAEHWEADFLSNVKTFSHADFKITYFHSDSLSEELDKNISGDIGLFSVTFTLMISYACVATLTARWDVVGQRAFLGIAGVLSAGLAIVSAFGICSACGADFVSIVGAIPFLIIGIGVDDMFLLMSGITEANYNDDIETRIADTMATSGVSITITSLTDLLAFAAGTSSVFLGVRNFCIYAGVAVVFCYLNQASIFIACITINEQRTVNNRHFVTCKKLALNTNDEQIEVRKVKHVNGAITLRELDDEDLEEAVNGHTLKQGAVNTAFSATEKRESTQNLSLSKQESSHASVAKTSQAKPVMPTSSPRPKPTCSKEFCSYICCTGRPSRSQAESESHLDKFPRWSIPKIVSPVWAKVIILVLFAIYLGISIYGVTEMKQGLDLQDLVAEDSYAYAFQEWNNNFPGDTIVSFILDTEIQYSDANTKTAIKNFITGVQNDIMVRDDFEINWYTSFDPYADYSSETAYVTGLEFFLAMPANSRFQNDVVIDTTKKVITQSRVHMISETLTNSQEMGKFMLRMRELAADSSLSLFAFSPAFLYYEQYVVILEQTLQTVGIAVAMVFFVTCLFMPHPLLLIYITFTVIMITVGIFGFIDFVGLTLSSITMIHLVMSIGFSVDFAAHICHGYMISTGKNRNERMINGIIRSGAPIFHGALSSLIGVFVLVFAKSFIFYSFFKVMSLVIIFGILHALFLLPVVLSFIGPAASKIKPSPENEFEGSAACVDTT